MAFAFGLQTFWALHTEGCVRLHLAAKDAKAVRLREHQCKVEGPSPLRIFKAKTDLCRLALAGQSGRDRIPQMSFIGRQFMGWAVYPNILCGAAALLRTFPQGNCSGRPTPYIGTRI